MHAHPPATVAKCNFKKTSAKGVGVYLCLLFHMKKKPFVCLSVVYMFYVVKVKGGTFTKDDSYEMPEMGCV